MRVFREFAAACIILVVASCGEAPEKNRNEQASMSEDRLLRSGAWRGTIEIQGRKLPFQMEVAYPAEQEAPRVEFINGEERVPVEEVHIGKDRVAFVLPAFNTRMDLRFKDKKLSGTLTKINTGEKEQKMPVTLTPGESHRFFEMQKPPSVDVSGRWSVTFEEPDGGNYPAVGEFEQNGSQVTGTFMTPTSDYRYLAGEIRDKRLYLSAWDGFHVFLFEADVQEDSSLKGDFWSGPSWQETWTAKRDPDAELPDMDRQTFLREGVERFDFTFPDQEGQPLSLSDPRFQNKVVVVQLAGSWCPNCADETRFLAPWYAENRDRGVEVVALMFEHFGDFERAAKQVRTWRKTYGVEYPTLIAGTSDKQEASAQLPQLNAFLAFPTTIFIAADGRVARIQTGFNGPATKRFEAELAKFNATIDALLAERDENVN
ncbi:MAG: TlpA family protein disulfide reductase [Proteobacteria bacterium]|nr:TlpA family protein disulfide reductase [Pseudomonadota bacterium]